MNEQPAADAEYRLLTQNTAGWAVQAILEEYKFCCSLISLYRGFQMQAFGFTIVLYAALLGLVGATVETDYMGQVVAYSTAFLSYPIAFLIAAIGLMDIRIVRTSRYIQFTIYERLQHYLGLPEDSPLLEYEKVPNIYLSRIQREMSSSASFIVIVALPAVIAAIWNICFSPVAGRNLVYIALLGLGLLMIISTATVHYARAHEAR